MIYKLKEKELFYLKLLFRSCLLWS